MLASIETADSLVNQRLEAFPTSPFFAFAEREIQAIKAEVTRSGLIDANFYGKLNIGLMCARELEQSDPQLCDVVYAMLEDIRPK